MLRKTLSVGMMAASIALAGMGHNLPPVPLPTNRHGPAELSERNYAENKRNQKLKQKRRKAARRKLEYRFTDRRAYTGSGYHPGKLFKGHRI